MEKKTGELSPKTKKNLWFVVVLCISSLVYFISYSNKEYYERVELLKQEWTFNLIDTQYNMNNMEEPYQYIVEYEIKRNDELFSSDYVYVFDVVGMVKKRVGRIDPVEIELKKYRVFLNGNEKVYSPEILKEKEVEGVTIVGEGMSKEALIEANPNSMIIGQSFGEKGTWIVKSRKKVEYDFADAIVEGMMWHYEDLQE
ncbi:hypothetical protein QTG56_25560 (plasmid) [Rossellomorea sp. AcN35-11]|nr:hypothetical protein [Rossellomorea aquimaris]WJV31983.1 hypothetical protein QTG56_25560 [Rossellomorea sp. AcN35-11]